MEQEQQQPTKGKGGTIKLVLIVALIALLAGGAGMYFLLQEMDKETTSGEVTENNTVSPTNEIVNNTVENGNNTTSNGGGLLEGLFGNGGNDDENNTLDNNTITNTVEPNNTIVNNTVDNNTTVPNTNNTTTPSTNNNASTNANVKESTAEKPLNFGEWGMAAKYISSTVSEEYKGLNSKDVPVSVAKVTRGKDAEKIVKEWCDNSTYYKYEAPKKNMEWAIVTYKVDLTGLKFDEGTYGTQYDIYSSVTGKDGGSIEYKNMRYYVSTTDITSSEYVTKPGVYEGSFAVQLPVGCTDYVIKMGNEYNGAVSYFKGK